ncbi:MAG: SDR family oxidoreductase [Gammaproteobacteria bacterium]|nr:SDR family oxidoreductase [Gammaproteobacteria bacterium]
MDLGLKNKVVIISGASQGLGYASALSFAREGAKIAICSRKKDRIELAAAKIKAEIPSADILALPADVTETHSIQQFVNQVIEKWGTVHVCITNTGGPPSIQFMEAGDEVWQQSFNLTLMSAVRLSRAVVPLMQKQQWGRIIHICSASVKNPIPNLLMSNAIRSAVVAMSKTQSNELAADNILVNCLLPGWTDTERVNEIMGAKAKYQQISLEEAYAMRKNMIPLKRMGKPEEIANSVVFLASEPASFITGTTLTVDGGETRVPF